MSDFISLYCPALPLLDKVSFFCPFQALLYLCLYFCTFPASLYLVIFLCTFQASLYYGLSIIIGIILSVIWAICFAVNSFVLVWLYQPMIKLNFAWLRMFSILYNAGVRVALDPVYKSCALVFSSIAGKFTFDMRGLQDKTAITTL